MKLDKKLIQYCLYFAGTALLIYAGISLFDNIGGIINFISRTIGYFMQLIKPLFIALIIAYLLYPGVKFIEEFLRKKNIFKKEGTRRTVGIVTMYILVIAIFIAVISGIYIMVGGKLSNNTSITNMTLYLTDYLNNSTLSVNSISEKLESLNISLLGGNLNDKIAQIVSSIQVYVTNSIGAMGNFVVNIGGNIATFFIALVLSIYLIKDSEYFIDLWNKIFNLIFGKSKAGNKLREVFNIINDTFNNYIKGQLLEAFMVGVLSTVVLFVIGIDYALVIGIIAGICNMIPYIGPVVGTILAVVMALLSGEPITAIWAIVGMLVVQQIDNNLLAPKIVGDSVGLHPVFTMLAILIGGNVGGLIGMLIGVPLAASLKILFSRWYANHMEKAEV
jgi:predicted PurR-regulated permease PerM